MSNPRNTALLAAIAILISGCGSSGKPADQSGVKPPASSASSDAHAAIPGTGLQPLTAEELNAPQIATAVSCNIEGLGNAPFATAPLDLTTPATTISGWVLSEASRKSGTPAQLRFVNEAGNGGWKVPIGSWIPRPDVISTMHGVDSGNVGFMQKVDLGSLPRGQYHVVVTFQDAGKSYSCDKQRVINIL